MSRYTTKCSGFSVIYCYLAYYYFKLNIKKKIQTNKPLIDTIIYKKILVDIE